MIARALLKRLAGLFLTLFVVASVIFLVMDILPGDPALVILGTGATDETLAALRQQMGLDQPAWHRFQLWIMDLLQGDFGVSYTYSVPVSTLLKERVVISLPLAGLAILLTCLLAFPAGFLAAYHHQRPVDHTVSLLAQISIAIPNFWFAILLILVFAVKLRWLPSGGFPGWDQGVLAGLGALFLPALALALPQTAILTRVMRSSLLELQRLDYLRTARAKGLSRLQALLRHGLRNAMLPIATLIGLQFSFLMTGTIIIENVFYLPGLGRLLFQAIDNRDLIIVKDVVLLFAALVILINFLIDILYLLIDPRLRDRRHKL